ncbi:MAG: hypothetical protein P4L33_14455 [Capsulimonadaceae bacterium]|nr:hypothetical protein [Capsulimonadaceae bacterium]
MPAKTYDVGRGSKSRLSVIGIDLLQHITGSGGYLPSLKSTKDLASLEYKAKLTDPQFIDPTSNKPFVTNPYYSNAKLAAIPIPNLTALVYDSGKAPDGLRADLLATLRVRRVSPDEWEVIKRQSHIDTR